MDILKELILINLRTSLSELTEYLHSAQFVIERNADIQLNSDTVQDASELSKLLEQKINQINSLNRSQSEF